MRLTASATTRSCSGNTVRRSIRTRPSSTRAMMGGSEFRSLAKSSSALKPSRVNASSRVGRTEEGAAPPPTTDSPSMISICIFRAPERRLSTSAAARAPISDRLKVMFHICQESRSQGCIRELIHAQRTKKRIAAHAGNQAGASTEDSRLRAAKQFVSAVRHNINSGTKTIQNVGLVAKAEIPQINQSAAAQVFHQRQI